MLAGQALHTVFVVDVQAVDTNVPTLQLAVHTLQPVCSPATSWYAPAGQEEHAVFVVSVQALD